MAHGVEQNKKEIKIRIFIDSLAQITGNRSCRHSKKYKSYKAKKHTFELKNKEIPAWAYSISKRKHKE